MRYDEPRLVWTSMPITSRGLGWRIPGSVEDTKLSTNKQHSLSCACACAYACVVHRDVHQLFQKRVQHAISGFGAALFRVLALFDSCDGVHELIWPRDTDNVKQDSAQTQAQSSHR